MSKACTFYSRNDSLYDSCSSFLRDNGLSVSEFINRCMYLSLCDYTGLFMRKVMDLSTVRGCRVYPDEVSQ